MSPVTWFRLLGLSALLIAAGFVLPGWTQTPKGEKHALLVGVNTYDSDGFSTLDFAENDVIEMEKVLKKSGFTVRVLAGSRGKDSAPTAKNFRVELDKLLLKRKKRDTVLVALAGHGVTLEVQDPDGKGRPKSYPFFCPADADLNDVKYRDGHSDTMLNLDNLFAQLDRCGAGAKLVLMDACRNQKAVKGRGSVVLGSVTIPRNVAALFSCGRDQVAHESRKLKHGIFFHYVIEGLKGEAKNRDGEVNWDDLSGYVRRMVVRNVKEIAGGGASQTPAALSNFEGEAPVLALFGKTKGDQDKEPIVKKDKDRRAITNSIGMELVPIRPGKFTMGTSRAEITRLSKLNQFSDYTNEAPEHEVEITKAFYMGAYEVTQEEYEKIAKENPSWFSPKGVEKEKVKGMDTKRFPVDGVSWEEADDFCRALSALESEKKAGRKYRLPSEAEWEYACRAGTSTRYHYGDSLSGGQANFAGSQPDGDEGKKGEYLGRPTKVGSYKPNAWGLYDMHGNVKEWCSDWYERDYYRNSPAKDPKGPAKGTERVLRGGYWNHWATSCRSADRHREKPTWHSKEQGFRVVCTVEE